MNFADGNLLCNFGSGSIVAPVAVSRGRSTLSSFREHYEIEKKFALDSEQFERLPGTLRRLGFDFKSHSVKSYYLSNSRGGSLRLQTSPRSSILTLKTFQEIEGRNYIYEREHDVSEDMVNMLILAYPDAPVLEKTRAEWTVNSNTSGTMSFSGMKVCLDRVTYPEKVKGYYVEIEVLATELIALKLGYDLIDHVAVELGLNNPVKKSYLKMMQEE